MDILQKWFFGRAGSERSVNYTNPKKLIFVVAHGCIDPKTRFTMPSNTSVHYVSRPGFESCVRLKENRTLSCILENIQRNFDQTYIDFHENLIQTYQNIFPYNSGLNSNREIHTMKFSFVDEFDERVSWRFSVLEFTADTPYYDDLDTFVFAGDELPNKTVEERRSRVITNLPEHSVLFQKINNEIENSMSGSVPMTMTLQDLMDYYGSGVYMIYTCATICGSSLMNVKELRDSWETLLDYMERNTVLTDRDGYTYKICDKFVPITRADAKLLTQEPDYRDAYMNMQLLRVLVEYTKRLLETTSSVQQTVLLQDMIWEGFMIYNDVMNNIKLEEPDIETLEVLFNVIKRRYAGDDEMNAYKTWFQRQEYYKYIEKLVIDRVSRNQIKNIYNALDSMYSNAIVKERRLSDKYSRQLKKQLRQKRKRYSGNEDSITFDSVKRQRLQTQ